MAKPKSTKNSDIKIPIKEKLNIEIEKTEDSKESIKQEETPRKKSQEKKYNQAVIANWIAGVAVLVSIILAIFTYSLFKQASTQTQAANKSAAAAITADSIANNSYHLSDSIYKASEVANKSTLAETKRYNTAFLKSQQDAINENKKATDLRDKREKESYDERKKEFEIENRPFLQVTNILIDSLEADKQIQISFKVVNSGKLPAKIETLRTQCFYSVVKENPPGHLNDGVIQNKTNSFIVSQVAEDYKTRGAILSKPVVSLIKDGIYYIYLFGQVDYENPVTSKKKIYSFKFKIYFEKKILKTDELDNSEKDL